eukprot:2739080-Alexandrium_andersonii.AAC.1
MCGSGVGTCRSVQLPRSTCACVCTGSGYPALALVDAPVKASLAARSSPVTCTALVSTSGGWGHRPSVSVVF